MGTKLMPDISVIVPVYNSEKTLEKCLNSLVNQTFSSIEFILVNDGSTDKSDLICKEFCNKDERFVYLFQENSGVSSARNAGLSVARGKYIGFCDSDDWLEPDMYEFLYNLINKYGSDISVCGHYIEINGETQSRDYEENSYILKSEEAIAQILKATVINEVVFGGFLWNKLIKKSIFENVRFPEDIHIYEDMLVICILYSKSENIAFQNTPKYHYVFNPQSALNGHFKEKDWTGILAREEILMLIEEKFPALVQFAQMGLVQSGMSLADKLVRARKLNRQNYKRIKKSILPYVNKKVAVLLGKNRSKSLKFFVGSRIFYIFYRKVLDTFRSK